MDTSPEYINMCRKATELQEMWKPETGDFYKLPGHFITCIVLKNSLIDMDAIWLPRIDQLLPLIYNCILLRGRFRSRNPIDILKYIIDEYGTGGTFNRTEMSEEEYFMMVLMYEEYEKTWNGEDWTCTSNTTA